MLGPPQNLGGASPLVQDKVPVCLYFDVGGLVCREQLVSRVQCAPSHDCVAADQLAADQLAASSQMVSLRNGLSVSTTAIRTTTMLTRAKCRGRDRVGPICRSVTARWSTLCQEGHIMLWTLAMSLLGRRGRFHRARIPFGPTKQLVVRKTKLPASQTSGSKSRRELCGVYCVSCTLS